MKDLTASQQAEVDNFLAHYGIPGMRWGIRKDQGVRGSRTAPAQIKKQAEQSAFKAALIDSVGKISGLKNSPKYKGKDLTKNRALREQYDKEAMDIFKKNLKKRARNVAIAGGIVALSVVATPAIGAFGGTIFGTTSTTTKLTSDPGLPGGFIEVAHSEVLEHSEGSTYYALVAKRDSMGFIESLDFEEKTISHSDIAVENFLAHHGIPGMRWGIRRERGPGGTVGSNPAYKGKTGTTATLDDKGKLVVSGGSVRERRQIRKNAKDVIAEIRAKQSGNEHLSDDAKRFLSAQTKSAHELSSKELKEINARAEAIRKYNDFFSPNPNRELQQKVERLRLEKEYGKLKAELHPSALQRVSRLIKSSAPMFSSVSQFANSKTGRKITKNLTETLADAFNTSSSSRPSRSRRTKTKGTPTSGATQVRVSSSPAIRREEPVYRITTL